jgi:hypothetical protein
MPAWSMLYIKTAEENGIDGVMNIINDQANEDYMDNGRWDGQVSGPKRAG